MAFKSSFLMSLWSQTSYQLPDASVFVRWALCKLKNSMFWLLWSAACRHLQDKDHVLSLLFICQVQTQFTDHQCGVPAGYFHFVIFVLKMCLKQRTDSGTYEDKHILKSRESCLQMNIYVYIYFTESLHVSISCCIYRCCCPLKDKW